MTIYIKPGCPWCIDVEAYLKKNGYEYERVNVIADRAAFKRMGEIFGTTSAPSMTVGDLKLADFGVEELVPFFERTQSLILAKTNLHLLYPNHFRSKYDANPFAPKGTF